MKSHLMIKFIRLACVITFAFLAMGWYEPSRSEQSEAKEIAKAFSKAMMCVRLNEAKCYVDEDSEYGAWLLKEEAPPPFAILGGFFMSLFGNVSVMEAEPLDEDTISFKVIFSILNFEYMSGSIYLHKTRGSWKVYRTRESR